MIRYSENNIILISLLQDLKCLDEIVQEILNDMKITEFKSWLFPHKDMKECKSYYEFHGKNREVTYVGCLEMIIEKLYVMFNHLVQQKVRTGMKKRNIFDPTSLTLGRCVQIFWETTNYSKDAKCFLQTADTISKIVINRFCQTEDKNNPNCDSCSEMDVVLKDMVQLLSENNEYSNTRKILCNVNENIFTTTQYGTTLKLADSIRKDFKHLVDASKQKFDENAYLLEELKRCKKAIREKQLEIDNLNLVKQTLNENFTKAEQQITSLISENNSLTEMNKNLQQSNDIIISQLEDTKKLIENTRTNDNDIKNNNEEKFRTLNEKVASCETINNQLKKNVLQLRKENEILFCKYSKMCRLNKKLEHHLEDVTNSIQNIDVLAENTLLSTKNFSDTSTELNESIKLLQRNYKEVSKYTDNFYKLHKVILEAVQDGNDKDKSENSVHMIGNPALDFRRQIQENERTIEKLRSQNEKFASIVAIYQKCWDNQQIS